MAHTGDSSAPIDDVVLVTGASSGLGRATVLAFLDAGAQVVGVARREALGRELEEEAGTHRLLFVAADLLQVAECERVVQATLARFGRLDVLVNNAAVRTDPALMRVHDVDEKNWDAVLDTNLKAPFFLTRFALAPMRARGSGLILNIASQTAEQATAGMAPYATSKAGLVQLTRSIAVEYLDDGIRANAILLGGTDTGQQHRTAAAASDMTPAAPPAAGPNCPTRSRIYSTFEVAQTLVLLARPEAATITGATIAIDHATTAGALTSAYTHQLIAATQSAN